MLAGGNWDGAVHSIQRLAGEGDLVVRGQRLDLVGAVCVVFMGLKKIRPQFLEAGLE